MMMMTSVQEKDKKEDKNDLNIQNHNSEFEILENNETLLSEKVRVFISKIETAELPDVERKADDENDVFILMRLDLILFCIYFIRFLHLQEWDNFVAFAGILQRF